MAPFRSEEDDVTKISTTMFITNFPEDATAKELYHACSVYGHVVDSFIPNKRAKNGKKFGFVRFINVFSEERLANNLCTVWMGRYKNGGNKTGIDDSVRKSTSTPNSTPLVYKDGNSYAKIVSGNETYVEDSVEKSPAMVIGEECLVSSDFSKSLFGRVKEFASLANIKLALENEGFDDISIKYLGEFWIMLHFPTLETKQLLRDSASVGSWFTSLEDASSDFHSDKRVAWVEIEGIPFKL